MSANVQHLREQRVNGLNTLADAGDFRNIGSVINTGQKGKMPHGSEVRLALYVLALKVLM
jgi:putative chitinase